MALGKKLKELLDDKNITVKEFAQNIGVAPTTLYSFIKRDSDTGKLDLISKISNGLGMSIEDFLQLDYEYQGKMYMPDGSVKNFYAPKSEGINTIAAHFEGEEFTEEELEQIMKFAEFVKSQRKDKD
ncbi:MAG: helix-turn-helix transcriptional regulator [Dorea sp.]|nr:helix-turn-helix transcriptional regulator [Dorea sp.]